MTRAADDTGLALTRFPSEVVRRLAVTDYGPLDPPPRAGTDNPAAWNRFDVAGDRTAYLAENDETAYAESLAWLRRKLGDTTDPLQADADAAGMTLAEFTASIEQEWADIGHMQPGHLPRYWRERRTLYRLVLPANGWWIDIEHPDTIAAIGQHLGGDLAALDVATLDRSVLLGPARHVTVAIASWMHDLVLHDKTAALGLTWQSKHGTGRCWAYWLRSPDHPTRPSLRSSRAVRANDQALVAVASRMGLNIW